MKSLNRFSNAALDYFDQLKPYTTNPRGPSQQLYKNYRNEGVGNYPHMQDYERTMAQLAAQKEQEQKISKEYEANKNKLIQEQEAKYNAQQAENERLRQGQVQQQRVPEQQLGAQQQRVVSPAEQMANIKKGGAWFTPSVRQAPATARQAPPRVTQTPATVIQKPSQGIQYPPGTQYAPTNWREMPPWSYPWGSPVVGSPGEVVSYSGVAPSWYGR